MIASTISAVAQEESSVAQEEICRVVDKRFECDPPPEGSPGGATASVTEFEGNKMEMAVDPSDLQQQMEAIVEQVGPGTARDMIDVIEGKI